MLQDRSENHAEDGQVIESEPWTSARCYLDEYKNNNNKSTLLTIIIRTSSIIVFLWYLFKKN